MDNTFTYTVLQYKHSLLLSEAINLGVLFSFPHLEHLEFVTGNLSRVKCLYPNFNPATFSYIIKNIETRIKTEGKSLFKYNNSRRDLKDYIHANFLQEDATSLQFSDPVSVVDTFNDYKHTINKFSTLLLPGLAVKRNDVSRHNENFILREYLNNISGRYKNFEKYIYRDKNISFNGVDMDFEIAWQNGSLNLVKPISFDLKEEQNIQSKATQYFGSFTLLSDYAIEKNYRFDLLVSKPTGKELYKSYDKALDILHKTKAPKRVITDTELKRYSEETANYLIELENN